MSEGVRATLRAVVDHDIEAWELLFPEGAEDATAKRDVLTRIAKFHRTPQFGAKLDNRLPAEIRSSLPGTPHARVHFEQVVYDDGRTGASYRRAMAPTDEAADSPEESRKLVYRIEALIYALVTEELSKLP